MQEHEIERNQEPYPVTVNWSHNDPGGTQLTSRARAATLLMVGMMGAGGGT